MLKEFKEFAMQGNVLEMAVGIIIGAAFGKIVTSLVNDAICKWLCSNARSFACVEVVPGTRFALSL